MHITRIAIKNFRLLKDVEISLEDTTTVIVGRNNSGKTSLTEMFQRLAASSSPTFRLEDFSLSVHEDFWNSFLAYRRGDTQAEIRKTLPAIEIQITVKYEKDMPDLGALSHFIIDVNPDCTESLIAIHYQLKDGAIGSLFDSIDLQSEESEADQKKKLFTAIKERVQKNYIPTIEAVDPNDTSNRKHLEFSTLRSLLDMQFINAQRGLDDVTDHDRNVLGRVLEKLFATAMSEMAAPGEHDIAEKLQEAVGNVQQTISKGFDQELNNLLPAFSKFGYPGLHDPQLRTETTLDVERLLTNHTKVLYRGNNGINLPEAYNGLGARNLIFILLRLVEFYKSFQAAKSAPGIYLVFIEEPEVHLHPQMQEVFINQINNISTLFARIYGGIPWPIQFIVSTHSSHLANKAAFKSIRYFLANADSERIGARYTRVKNLSQSFAGTSPNDEAFLHKYMTLTRCDLLFADKAVLIEGPTERILLPKMIEKLDVGQPPDSTLASQYISVVEVGGAYAHVFFGLLKFLELRTLVITDIDTIDGSRRACKVSEGVDTSNACIRRWFNVTNIAPTDLMQKSAEEKIIGTHRIAYQIPEVDASCCGRSFEGSFMLANPALFSLRTDPEMQLEQDVWEKSSDVTEKTTFALRYAIEETEWSVPRYIAEGLRWLADNGTAPCTVASTISTGHEPELVAQSEETHD